MRTLHVAALPFPSAQGTQGLLHAMLSALQAHGHDAHLLCYAHGSAFEAPPAYQVHRAAGRGASLRSGPSGEKLWLDVSLGRALVGLVRRLRPDAVIAHHVEAAALALALVEPPVLFVTHTSLASELPTFFPRVRAAPLAYAGGRFDRVLVRRAARTLAVSPLLADVLARDAKHPVHALTLPWRVPPPITPEERRAARRALGLDENAEVLLYAGNLDAYQGLAPMLAGIEALSRPKLQLVLATAAPRDEAVKCAATIARQLTVAPLADENSRRRVHAAADVALVPRRSPGGLPIKLLDALARGVPVVAQARALAGLPLASLCEVVPDDAPRSWAEVVARALRAAPEGRAAEARTYLLRKHDPAAFVAEFEAHVAACAAHP
ncbi:MAG: glycosyltransferase family 4 protein [Polyangiales bacterium]